MKFIKKHYLLLMILLIDLGLRLYRLADMANFDFDQEYAANFAYSVLKEYPVRMVGQGMSIQGLFMGPWYFYSLVPFFWFSDLHPIGGYVGSVLWGMLIIAAYYWVGSKMFNEKAGLIGAFIRAISFRAIEHDWSMVPSYSSELLVLLTWLLLWKCWQGNTRLWPYLFLLMGLYTSIHPIMFPFYVVFTILVLLVRKLPSKRRMIISAGMFILPILPLIGFDYFRNFAMSKQILGMVLNDGDVEVFIWRRVKDFPLQIVKNVFDTFSLTGLKSQWIYFYMAVGVFVVGLFKNKLTGKAVAFHQVMFPLAVLCFLVYYAVFPAHVPEYYLLPVSVLFWLHICDWLSWLTKDKLGLIGLAAILLFMSYGNISELNKKKWSHPNLTMLAHKDQIVREIISREDGERDFFVSYISEPGWNFGFDYLFKFYGRVPQVEKVEDPIYTIVIPKSLSPDSIDIASGNVGVILPE